MARVLAGSAENIFARLQRFSRSLFLLFSEASDSNRTASSTRSVDSARDGERKLLMGRRKSLPSFPPFPFFFFFFLMTLISISCASESFAFIVSNGLRTARYFLALIDNRSALNLISDGSAERR